MPDDGFVIDLSRWRSAAVDPGRRIADAEGGCLLMDLDAATAGYGLAAPSGTFFDTGIGGLTLGGGGHTKRGGTSTVDVPRGASTGRAHLTDVVILRLPASFPVTGGVVARAGEAPGRLISSAWLALGDSPLDRLFRAAFALCLGFSVLVLSQGIHGHAVLPSVDLVLDTIAMVACGVLTALAWARFRERQVVASAYHASAFLALAAAYAIAVLTSLRHAASLQGLAEPEHTQTLVFAIARLAAAILFVIAGVFTRRRTYGWNPVWILVAPMLSVVAAEIVGRNLGPPPPALTIIVLDDPNSLPQIAPFGAVIHLTIAALFFVGAYVSRSLWRSGRAVSDGWIAVGLVFAGFAELHWTLYPSAHPGQVSTADMLRLVCSSCLLAGLAAAFRASQRELRATNLELEQLRDAEVEHAATEERARLARELHDGLAQDLWLAKLRAGELVAMDGLPVEARHAAEGAAAAIDVGLADAREAVATLRSTSHADSGFCNLLRRTVDDYGDRFGLRVEFTFEGNQTVRIAPRTQAEILRIAQEALANVARHAGATLVGVRLVVADARINLRIADNGHGFATSSRTNGGYGLLSMHERAALIGGRLRVASAPDRGTVVILRAPAAPPPPAGQPTPGVVAGL